jgi:hypothetical protein
LKLHYRFNDSAIFPVGDSESRSTARSLVAPELHDAHAVGRLAVICQGEFGDPKITAANDSSDSKPLFARLTSVLVLYLVSTAGSLERRIELSIAGAVLSLGLGLIRAAKRMEQ